MGKPWESQEKVMGKSSEVMGRSWEDHGKVMGKQRENNGKVTGCPQEGRRLSCAMHAPPRQCASIVIIDKHQ